MRENETRRFHYLKVNEYDSTLSINGEDVPALSVKAAEDYREKRNIPICGETFENRKRDKNHDVGSVELADKRLFVAKTGTCSNIFRKRAGYVVLEENALIAILKIRLLPILLAALLVIGGVMGVILWPQGTAEVDPEKEDPYIKPIDTDILTVSGKVSFADVGAPGAALSLQKGDSEIAKTSTDGEGNYLFSKISSGIYNLVVSYDNMTTTKLVVVDKLSVKQNVDLKYSNLSIKVDIADEKTPPVAVSGLDEAGAVFAEKGKRVDITMVATKLEDETVPVSDAQKISALSGETTLSYFDFSIFREISSSSGIKESKDGIYETEHPLEIAVPYDTTRDIATYVFRCHKGTPLKFTQLSSRPTDNYTDGTYYVSSGYVFVYTKYFSTYAIGSASSGRVVKGSDTITYSDIAYVNLTTGIIEMMYQHDEDSTHYARVEIYLEGSSYDLLISTSGMIPPGSKLDTMVLGKEINGMPSVGTYQGLMKIIYLSEDGQASTNVNIPLKVAISK